MKWSLNRFPLVTIRPDGRSFRSALQIKCGSCRATDHMVVNPGGRVSPELVAKQFSSRGWLIGRRATDDTCPKCADAAAAARRRPPQPAPPALAAPVAIPAEEPEMTVPAPRTMQRPDRRRIADELEAHYPEPEKGYRGGMTDEIVATKLNVPRAWVTQVREEMFGPAFVVDVADLDRRHGDIQSRLKSLGDEFVKRMGELEKEAADFGRLVEDLKRRAAPR